MRSKLSRNLLGFAFLSFDDSYQMFVIEERKDKLVALLYVKMKIVKYFKMSFNNRVFR